MSTDFESDPQAYYAELESRLLALVAQVESLIAPAQAETIIDLIDAHGESGLALDWLVYDLEANQGNVPEAVRREIHSLATKMGMLHELPETFQAKVEE